MERSETATFVKIKPAYCTPDNADLALAFQTRHFCGSLHNLRSVVGVSLYLDWFEGEPDQEVCAPVCYDCDSRGGGSRLLPEELGHEEPGDRARTHGETHHEQNHHHNRDVGEGLGLKANCTYCNREEWFL